MTWIFYSVCMFTSSVAMYLLVRKAKEDIQKNEFVTFAVGALPVVFLGFYLFITRTSIIIPFQYVLLAMLGGIFFSFLGNKFSVLGIQSAPNPGYSLIIQKSYAIFTSVASVFLFGSELPIIKIVAILVVIISSGQIMIEPKTQSEGGTKRNNAWLIHSFISFFAFGLLALLSTYLVKKNITPAVVSFYYFFFAGIAFTINYRRVISWDDITKLAIPSVMILLAIGAFNAAFNIFMKYAFIFAPNVGYVNVINTSSIMAITLLSALFFHDRLSMRKLIGILGVICGLVLIFL